jgi:hypothetical protein
MYFFNKTLSIVATLLCAMMMATFGTNAIEIKEGEEGMPWPRDIVVPQGTITIYQPQPESFENNILDARAAVSVTLKDKKEPVFGAVWFTCRMDTDLQERMVYLVDIAVKAAKFPEASEKWIEEFSKVVETEIPKWEYSISLDRLIATLEAVEREQEAAADFNNDPPKIHYRSRPAVLVSIDGEPIIRDLESTNYKYIMNTPFLIMQDPKAKRFYLKGGEFWYTAEKVEDEWKHTASPPKEIVEIADKMVEQEEEIEEAEGAADSGPPPEIIVSTEPAELITAEGAPSYKPITGVESILYMDNTDSDIFMEISTQRHFVLLSGRWYATRSLTEGPWEFVPPGELPEDFKKISPESEKGSVLVSVPGTQEAREAVLENEIPQTAEVDREKASVEVEYDGDPKFEDIEDTEVQYAVNTDKSVLLIDNRYYCCHDAVWFVSNAPIGPWAVCVEVPAAIQTIPPSCPVYNVRYVHVYNYTPSVVYVGYTPGYVCSYTYYGTVVYGTGYWYRPWYGYHYYPRPVTYGFGVHWNPYTGWGFSVGFTFGGWFHVRVGGPGYGGWWGPAGYHAGYRHGYYHGMRAGYYAGMHASRRPVHYNNVYRKHPSGAVSTMDRKTKTRAPGISTADRSTRPGTAKPRTRENNVFTDRDGNTYRKTDKGWEQRTRDGWKSTDPNARPSSGSRDARPTDRSRETRPSDASRQTRPTDSSRQTRSKSTPQTQRSRQSDLERQHNARQRGNTRSQNYQKQARPQSSGQRSTRQRPSGGRRR